MEHRSSDVAVTVDLVALSSNEDGLRVVLVRRRHDPYLGRWALPGGFLDVDEDLPEAASREMFEETGIRVAPSALTQVGAYGAPGRDPRMRTVTIAFAVIDEAVGLPVAGDDAVEARSWPVEAVLRDPGFLAFDHHQILSDALFTLAVGGSP